MKKLKLNRCRFIETTAMSGVALAVRHICVKLLLVVAKLIFGLTMILYLKVLRNNFELRNWNKNKYKIS